MNLYLISKRKHTNLCTLPIKELSLLLLLLLLLSGDMYKTRFSFVTQASLDIKILLPQLPECGDTRH